MASWLVLPYYFALCSCVLFSTATGTATLSAGRAYSCPGSMVIFTCVVNTTVLSWDIDFLSSHDDINRISFFSSDSIGLQLSPHTSQGTVYAFNLTSKSPLTSTITTIASTDLSGATISCQDEFTSSAHVDTLVVEIMPEPQKPSNVTAVMPPIPTGYDAAGSLNITLEWDDELDPIHLGHTNQISNYTIAIFPEAANSESIFYTVNTSIPLGLHYDQDYNISVVASNCVGNSTPAQIHIRLVHCGPSIGKDVSSSTWGNRVDKLKTYCLHSPGLVFTPEEVKPEKSTLTDDCSKNGSIHQHSVTSVSEILVPALTASHLLLSSCTLIIGLLLGSLSHRCCWKKTESFDSMDKEIAEEPVYSEIPPKTVPSVHHVSELVKSVDNVAYGQVLP